MRGVADVRARSEVQSWSASFLAFARNDMGCGEGIAHPILIWYESERGFMHGLVA
jgi:hypothetical protein